MTRAAILQTFVQDIHCAFRSTASFRFEYLSLGLVVRNEEMLDLINQVIVQVFQRSHILMNARFGGDGDQTVIALRLSLFRLFGFNNSY